MKNYETEAAWHYHNGTKHPNGMLLNRFHVYHPSFRPTPYKQYKNIKTVPLKLDKRPIGVTTLDAISENRAKATQLDVNAITRILYFSSGITKTIKFDGLGEVDFRAASCTGALYHIEAYLVSGNMAGLDAGVYHFDPKNMNLGILRVGDFRGTIIDATSGYNTTKEAEAFLVFTDVFARNSIKYQTREYRHAFWDCGTILANTLAITSAHKIQTEIITGFVDNAVCNLLGLDITREAPLVIVPLGKTSKTIPASPDLIEINPESTTSEYETEYPEINSIHESSCIEDKDEITKWRHCIKPSQEKYSKLIPLKENITGQEYLEDTIIKRGSTRSFSHESITLEQLSTILSSATNGMHADFINQKDMMSKLYIIVNAVDGLDSGSYYYVKEKNALEELRKGNFRHVSGNLGLDQDLPYDCSVAIFLLVDLDGTLEEFGNRGYRVAQLESAIIAGKMYLASYALGLGATGLTFYDDAVTSFFSPHAKAKEVMFLIAIGKKSKKS